MPTNRVREGSVFRAAAWLSAHQRSRAEAEVFSWGWAERGELASGYTAERADPQPVFALRRESVVASSTSEDHSLYLTDDGRVFQSGNPRGDNHERGPDLLPKEVSVPGAQCVHVCAGSGVTYAVTGPVREASPWLEAATGRVARLSELAKDPRLKQQRITLERALAEMERSLEKTATRQRVAEVNRGRLFAWGLGTSGQLGLGVEQLEGTVAVTYGSTRVQTSVDLSTRFTSLDEVRIAGEYYRIAAFGMFDEREITIAVPFRGRSVKHARIYIVRHVPKPQMITLLQREVILQVSTGTHFVVAVTQEGGLFSWGRGRKGQLGHGDRRHQHHPTRVESIAERYRVRYVSAGDEHVLAVAAGYVWVQGAWRHVVLAWGCGGDGRIGLGDEVDRTVPLEVPSMRDRGVVAVAAGGMHSLALAQSGAKTNVFAWGANGEGQLGVGHTQPELEPAMVISLSRSHVVQLAAGRRHSIAITSRGEVFTWGLGRYGETGHGDLEDPRIRCNPWRIQSFGHRRATHCSAGPRHSIVCVQPEQHSQVNKLKNYEPERLPPSLALGTGPQLYCVGRRTFETAPQGMTLHCKRCDVGPICRCCARHCHADHEAEVKEVRMWGVGYDVCACALPSEGEGGGEGSLSGREAPPRSGGEIPISKGSQPKPLGKKEEARGQAFPRAAFTKTGKRVTFEEVKFDRPAPLGVCRFAAVPVIDEFSSELLGRIVKTAFGVGVVDSFREEDAVFTVLLSWGGRVSLSLRSTHRSSRFAVADANSATLQSRLKVSDEVLPAPNSPAVLAPTRSNVDRAHGKAVASRLSALDASLTEQRAREEEAKEERKRTGFSALLHHREQQLHDLRIARKLYMPGSSVGPV